MGTGTAYNFTKDGEAVIGGLYNNLVSIVPLHAAISADGAIAIGGLTGTGVAGLYVNSDGTLAIGGITGDDEVVALKMDTATNTLMTIDYAHHEVHAGSHFFYTDKTELGSTGTTDYIDEPTTDDTWAHMLIRATGSAITQIDVYEDTTRTGTTDVTTFNSDRNSTDSAVTTVYKGSSTDGADGTLILTHKSGGATQQSRAPMEWSRANEIILKSGSKYLLRFTSGTASNLCNLVLEWYEHTNA